MRPGSAFGAAAVAAVLALLALGPLAAPAAATHDDPAEVVCRYEAPLFDLTPKTAADPAGATADGHLDLGGCIIQFPATGGDGQGLLGPARTVEGEHGTVHVTLSDDVFGDRIGGAVCYDHDVDGNVCDGPQVDFCRATTVTGEDTDGNGHDDFGPAMAIVVNGPIFQALECDPVQNPIGATSGEVRVEFGG